MNRIIKFRLWEIWPAGTKGRMIYDCQKEYHFEDSISQYNDAVNNNNYVLMQFTGLLDKNGKEIYEGDILRMGEEIGKGDGEGDIDIVVYKGSAFITNTDWDCGNFNISDGISDGNNYLEVIGNIFENPELLNQ